MVVITRGFAVVSLLRGLTAVACVAAALAACGGRDGPSPKQAKAFKKGLDGEDKTVRSGIDANTLYADAMALKAHGDCTAAVPKLRQVASLGPGYEGAQTALGECLIQPAKLDLSSDYAEGLIWLIRAA